MPQLGDIKRGTEIGQGYTGGKFIFHACPECGKERWVRFVKGAPYWLYCQSCSKLGNTYRSKGRHQKTYQGYTAIYVPKRDFFFPMAHGGYAMGGFVLEHRLVMAKHLGRNLHRWEIVHHKNHIKDDNRIENLQLVTDDRHKQITILENEITRLKNYIALLEMRNPV